LKILLGRIAEDAAQSAARGAAAPATLIFCGDYIDRGPRSAEVLEALVWLSRRDEFELRLLKGNHEQALLEFLDHPEEAGNWIGFGGAETLRSYGVPPPAADDRRLLVAARDALVRNLPASHRELLDTLELMVTIGDFAFVHAGIRPGVALDAQIERDLLWIREDFLCAVGPFEKVVVHGHTWTEGLQVMEHRICIDTGAYATGVLTALRLHEEELALFDTSARGPVRPGEPRAI
jgi:serine/threonine protein phosphatase 1